MNKNSNFLKNALDNKSSKSNRTYHETGVKTSFYTTTKNNSEDIYVKVTIFNNRKKPRTINLPASTLMYWYPFYYYYDWGFKGVSRDLVLKVADNAPESAKYYQYHNLYLTDCVNLKTYETHVTKIYEDNVALMSTLMDISGGRFTTLFNKQISAIDITFNTQFISETIDSIRANCKERYDKAYKEYFSKPNAKPKGFKSMIQQETFRDRILYEYYATDSELSLMLKLGAGSRVTYILNKLYGGI